MSEFEAKKLNLANINSGQKYQNGDGLQAKAFNALVEATLQNSNDIDFIDMILEGNNMYAELELSEAYTSRVTANGANIFDGQLTPVESIRGSTVKSKNLIIPRPSICFPLFKSHCFCRGCKRVILICKSCLIIDNYKIFTFNRTAPNAFNRR